MVDCQVRPSDVTKFPIIEALLMVPREAYVPAAKKSIAYAGEHIPLSADRVLLDARTFAKMLDSVNIRPTDLVLDLGCGMGYSSAVIARLAEAVVAVEEDADLAAVATETLSDMSVDNVLVTSGRLSQGNAKHGPYDLIVTEGAIEELPQEIADQVKDGGRIVAILQQDGSSQCRIGHKSDGNISWRFAFDASAPLLAGFEAQEEFAF